MIGVVIDTNVAVSHLTERHVGQQDLAEGLFERAGHGELVAIVPQFVLFEIAFVLGSVYEQSPPEVAKYVAAIVDLPGVVIVDDCPWPLVLEIWPKTLKSLADAAIVSVAIANRYDQIATFDRQLVRKLGALGLEGYW